MRGLAVTEPNRVKIVQEGGLEPLIKLLRVREEEDVALLREASAALCNLSLSEQNKYETAKAGSVAPLLLHAQAEDQELAFQACAALANLAEIQENQLRVASQNGVETMARIMRSPLIPSGTPGMPLKFPMYSRFWNRRPSSASL